MWRDSGPLTLHDTAQGIEHSLGGEVFRGDQVDEVLLASFLLDGVSWGGSWMYGTVR